jgi:hypothetical protein
MTLVCSIGSTVSINRDHISKATLDHRLVDTSLSSSIPKLGHEYLDLIDNARKLRLCLPSWSDKIHNTRISGIRERFNKIHLDRSDSIKEELNADHFYNCLQTFIELRQKALNYQKISGISASLDFIPIEWSDAFTWLKEIQDENEPPYDPIVEIAQCSGDTVERLLSYPRRLLRREREKVHLAKLEEIDEGCMRWMVRQPGRNLAERAGSQQHLLGIVRKDNFDTFENRVLREFCHKAMAESFYYTQRHSLFSKSSRWRKVRRYGRFIREKESMSDVKNASRLKFLMEPNFVLQFDRNYRKIWAWFLMLIRQEEQIDKARLWRGRLWSDHCRLMLTLAIAEKSQFEVCPPAGQRLWLRKEQDDGLWMAQWGAPVFRNKSAKKIAQLVTPDSLPQYNSLTAKKFRDAFGTVGASFALLIWDENDSKNLDATFYICEPRCREVWGENLEEELNNLSLLAEVETLKIAILCPSNDMDITLKDSPNALLSTYEIPSGIRNWKPSIRNKFAQEILKYAEILA